MKPRLLLVAYCCSPNGGSEPAVGWTLARLASEHFRVTVLVEKRKFAAEIEEYLAEHGPLPDVTFEFVPEKWWAHGMWAAGLGYVSYRWWHDRALAHARTLHASEPFDAVQLGTIIGFREPGRWTELGVPFVWGPVGGTHNYVSAFLGEAGTASSWKERVRSATNTWQLHRSRRVRKALNDASIVVAATSQTGSTLQEIVDREIAVISEITLVADDSPATSRPTARDGLRVYWAGVHEPRKCLSLLIRAVASLPVDVPVTVRVAGDGPMTKRWQSLAKQLGVADRFEWLGWLPHDVALEQLEWADVFAFTSVRDTTGTVLLEALNAGVPVITLDHQGAGDVITDDAGIKIPVSDVQMTIRDYAEGLVTLATDDLVRTVLSEGAVRRADAYRYQAKREQWLGVWRPLLENVDTTIEETTATDQSRVEEAPLCL